jgi:hypothetical protein
MKTEELTSGVCVHKCDSWDEFTTKIRANPTVFQRIFRGQRDVNWKLSSRWERWLLRQKGGDSDRDVRELFSEGAYERIRDRYLERFKEYAVGLPTFNSAALSDDRDWWALGRHHGLITALLDWTYSPYIAAFFAFISAAEEANPGLRTTIALDGAFVFPSEPVAVWELKLDNTIIKEHEFEVFSSRTQAEYRRRVQQGVFTYLAHAIHVDIESYLESRGFGGRLARYEVPGQQAAEALTDLGHMNITYMSMFPDLDGAASQANVAPLLSTLGLTLLP